MVVLGSGGKGGGGEPEITFSLVSNLWKWKGVHFEMMPSSVFMQEERKMQGLVCSSDGIVLFL